MTPEEDLGAVINKCDADPKPLRWTKSADGILASIERFFSKIKHFRRVATRYDKLARSYTGFLNAVAALKAIK